jgi:hypothetical protein
MPSRRVNTARLWGAWKLTGHASLWLLITCCWMNILKMNRCCIEEWIVMINYSCINWYRIHSVLLSLFLLKKLIAINCTTLIRWVKISTICNCCTLLTLYILIKRSSCNSKRIMSSERRFIYLTHGHCHVWCWYEKWPMNWSWRINARFIMLSWRQFWYMFWVNR